MSFIESQKWRYATKKFDTSKKVSETDLDQIKESIQLTATSYGLQLFKTLIIQNTETREALKQHSWGQSQITDASHLLVFCNYSDVTEEHINECIQLKAKTVGIKETALKGYGDFIKSKMTEISTEQKSIWNSKQTYMALGNAMAMCAELRIDACPMEGFSSAEYNTILGLTEKGLESSLVLAIGYRSVEDAAQHAPKVRKSISDLFEVV